jgi:hypothetical protein
VPERGSRLSTYLREHEVDLIIKVAARREQSVSAFMADVLRRALRLPGAKG